MLVSEEQAKRKWCRHARSTVTLDSPNGFSVAIASGNRFMGENVAICMGANCMSWRWAERPFEFKATGSTAPGEEAPQPEGEGWEKTSIQERHDGLPGHTQNWRRPKPGRLGFCAADGPPEYPE